MRVPKYSSKNFSLAVEREEDRVVIIKKPLQSTVLISYNKQLEIYDTLKKYFGDIYNTTTFELEDNGWYKAISPHIQWELLCNFSSLNTDQLRQLISFQKQTIRLALNTGIIIDFFGSNPNKPVNSKLDVLLAKLHKYHHTHFSSNIIWSKDGKLVFIDTYNHQQDYNTKPIVFLINLSILTYGIIKHTILYYKKIVLHLSKQWNASS